MTEKRAEIIVRMISGEILRGDYEEGAAREFVAEISDKMAHGGLVELPHSDTCPTSTGQCQEVMYAQANRIEFVILLPDKS